MKEGELKDRKRSLKAKRLPRWRNFFLRGGTSWQREKDSLEGTENAVERSVDEIQIVSVGQQMLLNGC